MSPVTLEGDTLGQKRRHFNKLVEDAIVNKNYKLCNINDNDSDIDNLLKIDIASKNRNADYIIEVMKSNDKLYAAMAIKRSTWLITDPHYANIINPEYLHTQLLPSLNTRTFNKLMLHIRLNLKDETRVESFYEYLKHTDSAYKWLQNCSIPFIENVIQKERHIPVPFFKRLCKRSAHFLAYYSRKLESHKRNFAKDATLFLLKSHTEEVLNILEDKHFDYIPPLGKKKTEILMKACPQRILDKFDQYVGSVHLSVVARYMNKKEIKPFLSKNVKYFGPRLYDYNNLRHFIRNIPEEERFEYVRKTFIDKTETAFPEEERKIIESIVKPYQWYEYTSFNVALCEIKKLIRKENSAAERCGMLSVLVTCARSNPQDITTLLKFVNKKHINEPLKFKIQFVNHLLSQIPTHNFDDETWNLLDQWFHSIEVYTQSENTIPVQQCLQSIIVYKVLHDEPVPQIVERKTIFTSYKRYQKILNQNNNSKLFTYLLNKFMKKVQSVKIALETDLNLSIFLLMNVFTFLTDWEKNIIDYPFVLDKIQEIIKIKQENLWKSDLSYLYVINKSWRKHMLEESLSLSLSEESCLNALKHKPQLLKLHDEQIDSLRTDDYVSLQRLLTKLRVYWPNSLAQHWADAYLQNLNKPTGQKSVIKGLFTLFTKNQVIDLAKKHVPYDSKINWGETDHTEISLRKNIAKHLHLARPMIPLDSVLWYAKGDYLQYAVPSLDAISFNLSEVESRKYLPRLLDAPVSLQKYGIYLAFLKFQLDDLKSIFMKVWNDTNNLTIRSNIFKHTYVLMCKVKNPTVEMELWELLSSFMNDLNTSESIFKKVSNVLRVPITIRAKYFMKSYDFLTSLPASANCEKHIKTLIEQRLQ